ncbi:hypothetical protein [Sulfobacillus harzensis]|uniref:Uncharacterized protein n=1 Tax=Sulfobacillus harzensis TaxID=2729629 RepID=A0A7Y0Q2X6_9FIRM|nr:hypothetical protein [Sulfobacillus harzensis]NMP22820.1 hypothetical protein [Sulfobacillus harzensis]
MQIDELKRHFIRHLLAHEHGLSSDTLERHVENSAGPLEVEHRELLRTWTDALVGRGHIHRDGDWVNLSEEGRLEAFRLSQASQVSEFNGWPF